MYQITGVNGDIPTGWTKSNGTAITGTTTAAGGNTAGTVTGYNGYYTGDVNDPVILLDIGSVPVSNGSTYFAQCNDDYTGWNFML